MLLSLHYSKIKNTDHNKTKSYIFYCTGERGCPGDCDYHWYRLDNNGHWSHKAGGTPATDRDGNGDRIVDPRKAANGWIPYKFVCFMTIDKDTITIR